MSPSDLPALDRGCIADDTLSLDATEDASDSGSGGGLCAIKLADFALLHGSRNNSHMVLVAILGSIHPKQPLSGVGK